MTIVITSGYWNPFTVGHLDLFNRAATLGQHLIVIVNNDNQVKIKGSRPFMSQDDRMAIVAALKPVDEVFLSIDQDGSVCKSLEWLGNSFPKCDDLIFAKGGDRLIGNIPEVEVCRRLGIRIVDGLGAKIRASSEILMNM